MGVDLARPVDGDWRPVGTLLRDVQRMVARAANAGMRMLALVADENKSEAPLQTRVARRMRDAMQAERDHARAALDKPNTRREIRAMLERQSTLELASVVQDALASLVYKRWSTDRKALYLCDVSLPSFKRSMAIPIRDRGWKIERDKKGYVLTVKVEAGRGAPLRFFVAPVGGSAYATLRKMTDPNGGMKLGDCKLVYVERKRTWSARIDYAFEGPEAGLDQGRILAVHRGIRNFLTWADGEGGVGVIDGGADVRKMKDQMRRRRREQRAKIRSAGKGARGHGRRRLFRTYDSLADAEARWVDTKCKQVAAAVVKRAISARCGTIAIEDYSARELADGAEDEHIERLIRRFPFYKLGESIKWAADKNGIAVVTVESFFDSVTCPACGNVDATQDDKRGTFTCKNEKCQMKRSVDGVAAWNTHRKASGGREAFEKNREELEAFRREVTGDKKKRVKKDGDGGKFPITEQR